MKQEDEAATIPPPEFWSSRADEARCLADRFRDPIARTLMLDIANKYDHMAAHAARCRPSCPG
ncbi:hypothetical protein [Reyranella sp.]|uniref:hypothetical protein n=1 Tax=Reyranella sp. TaxID=1929291 RepID=UPI003D0A61F6